MLDVEKQRTFIRIAAGASPGVSARSLAEAAGFTGAYGPRLLRRHKDAIDRRRRAIENLGKARPRHQVAEGEQRRLWELTGTDLHLVTVDNARRWWFQARAEFLETELRWRTPAKMDELRAQREVNKARQAFERATEITVRVFEAHGEPIPADLMVKPERGRREATGTQQAVVDDAALDGGSPGGDLCRLHPSMPAKGCPLCEMAPQRCPRHGLLFEPTVIHGVSGPVGQRTGCPECEPGTVTIYATPRSRELAWSAPERVIASTGPGRTASPYAARFYDFDPFKDF